MSMLLNLHVKNLALIEEVDINFEEGLNILTGETGAGKSIIIGSINMAIGDKIPRDIIRKGKEFASIEMVFLIQDPDKLDALKALDVFCEADGQLIVSRKIMQNRSISKVNNETVTMSRLKQITRLLLDIHGQHEHQSLLYKSKHLEILDTYAKIQIEQLKLQIAKTYSEYCDLKEKLTVFQMDEESRLREIDFYKFEINEMEQANLLPNEEENLSALYRKYNYSKRIAESLSKIYKELGSDYDSAAERVSDSLKELHGVLAFDEGLKSINEQLYDIDSILSSVNREVLSYVESLSFDESEFYQIEKRLDVIHNIQAKYGDSYEKIKKNLEEKKKRLSELENYQELKLQMEDNLVLLEAKLEKDSTVLSEIRQQAAIDLSDKIRQGLADLNFLDVSFSISFKRLQSYTRQGIDEVEFMISTNPGETLKPLGMVASGGELSRIMLAIKTVLAGSDEIPTLIFDEIDTGISGRTAQKVSEKLSYIGKSHQVICITHLPQIAAMADIHFAIEKKVNSGNTLTYIRRLTDEEMVTELARLLGGAKITKAVLKNAKEMKELAERTK